ncbi:MAG: hypothetical protein CMK32_04205 [Porticoccaceae bacterium]|nr:hypothetical protein [Porticoccaceae bacterium]
MDDREPGKTPGRKIPWLLLALDIIGALLVARGFYLFIGEQGGVMYIVAGFLLMLPFGLHFLNRKPPRADSHPRK